MSDRFSFSIRLPARPSSVGITRSVIRSLDSVVHGEPLERAELVMSEIVTNAIRHGSRGGRDDIGVEITADSHQLSAAVSDSGPEFEPPPTIRGTEQIGGFGLHIAMTLADLAITHTPAGNTVRFAIPYD